MDAVSEKHDGDPESAFGERSGTVLTRGSSTEDDDFIVNTAIAHSNLLIPLRPRILRFPGPYPAGAPSCSNGALRAARGADVASCELLAQRMTPLERDEPGANLSREADATIRRRDQPVPVLGVSLDVAWRRWG